MQLRCYTELLLQDISVMMGDVDDSLCNVSCFVSSRPIVLQLAGSKLTLQLAIRVSTGTNGSKCWAIGSKCWANAGPMEALL